MERVTVFHDDKTGEVINLPPTIPLLVKRAVPSLIVSGPSYMNTGQLPPYREDRTNNMRLDSETCHFCQFKKICPTWTGSFF